jgi:hypothetical protein
MLRGEFESAGERTPDDLRADYEARLRATIDRLGAETVARRAGIDRDVVAALAAGESPELTLEAAAAILACEDATPDGETIELEALDILLMGMTTAVLDVDALAAGLDGEFDFDPKEIQQKIEGRHPITLTEYAAIHSYVASEGGV